MPGRRLKFAVSYDGTAYHGWQVQPGLPTIQGTLEAVLARIEGAEVDVAGSGRTDAGVHALAQVAACTLANPIPPANLRKAMNRLLPRDIRILAVEEVDAAFHPRFHATAKTYEYRIWRDEVCPPFLRDYVYHFPYPLDETAFAEAAGLYRGVHDFSAFAASDEKDALGGSKVREIFEAGAARDGATLTFRVRGSGFLKHMVRLMTGGLIEVAKGNLTVERLKQLLAPRPGDRQVHAVPARGLFLIGVDYRQERGRAND
jgi:tRNA pseudouridine38-40 synthase